MANPLCYKVHVEYEKDETGDVSHEPQIIAITKNDVITSIDKAVAHLTAIIGQDRNGKPVTRIHHKDINTGEFFSIAKATPVADTPFRINEVPVIRSLADAPQGPTG